MVKAKIINGHIFMSFYCGTIVYNIDGKDCYDTATAARWLGITVDEFLKLK